MAVQAYKDSLPDTMSSGMLAAVVVNNNADMAVRPMELVTNTMTVSRRHSIAMHIDANENE